MKKIISLLTLSSMTLLGQAQCEVCEKVLVQDFLQVNYSESISMHYLNTVNSDNYYKKETQAILSGAFPLEGVPVGVNFDYNNFNDYRSRLFQQKNFNYSKDQSIDIIKKEFSANTLSAFNHCIEACNNSIGLFAYLYDMSGDEISIAYHYKPFPGSKEKLKIDHFKAENLSFRSSSDSLLLSNTNAQVNPFDLKIIRFKRTNEHKDSHINIDFSLNGTKISKEIKITALPVVKKYKIIRLEHADNGGMSKFSNVQIIRGAVLGDSDYGTGTIFIHDPSKNQNIAFGPWRNDQCGTGGTGWYMTGVGSCTIGGGSLIKGLAWVEVIVEDKSTN